MSDLYSTNITQGEQLPELNWLMTTRHIVSAAAASRDWQPLHHDYPWCTEQAGMKNIILNTPSQSGWLSAYVTDWTGAKGRIGRIRFRMKSPVNPGDEMAINGTVNKILATDFGWSWVELALTISVAGQDKTTATITVALADDDSANPWFATEDQWNPPG